MSKQDRQGVRSPADLERKYNFGQFANQANETARLSSQINQLDKTLSQQTGLISDLEDRVEAVEGMTGVDVGESITQLEQSVSSLEHRMSAVEQLDQETYGYLVTVATDSLNSESISADKTFVEIEAAILAGQNVRVKVVGSETSDIYLVLASHHAGAEATFHGFHNGMPIVLQILAEETTE